MIDISILQFNMGFWSNSRCPPCKFGCENALLIVKISAQNVYQNVLHTNMYHMTCMNDKKALLIFLGKSMMLSKTNIKIMNAFHPWDGGYNFFQ